MRLFMAGASRKLYLVSLSVLTLVTPLVYADYHGDDSKNYPGIMCVPSPPTGGKIGVWYGGITNTHETEWLIVDCPIIKDVDFGEGTDDEIANIIHVSVRVWDRTEDGDIWCAVLSARLNPGSGGHSSAIGQYAITYGHGPDSAMAVLTFSGWEAPHSTLQARAFTQGFVGTESHYFLKCYLPPKGDGIAPYISSYRVIEFGPDLD